MKRRLAVRKRKPARAPAKTGKNNTDKQRIYQARHAAKMKGVAPPPLPAAAAE